MLKRRTRLVCAVAAGVLWTFTLAWPGVPRLMAQPSTTPAAPSQPAAPAVPAPAPAAPAPAPAAPAVPSPFVPVPGAPQQTLPPQKVTAVEVRGNEHIPAAQILAVVSTKVGDPLSAQKLQNDVQAILGLGWFADAVVRLEPANEGVRVVFIVAENPVVAGIDVTGNTVVSTADIVKALDVPVGQVLNTVKMRTGAQAVERLYQDRGYVLARISDLSVNPSGVLTVTMAEGRIEAIKIQGLHKTKDYVVRRELTFKPGDVFNADAVNASLKKLFNLRYFSDVKAQPGPGTAPGTVDVTILVTEQRTATLSFGAGFSTLTGIAGLVGVNDIDFGGNGQTVSAQYNSTALNGNNFVLTFHEPYFRGSRTVFDFQAYNQTTVPTDYTFGLNAAFQYTMYQSGGQFTFTKPTGDGIHFITYGGKSVNTTFGPSILPFIPPPPSNFAFTPGIVNAILLGASEDTRNDKINPTSGETIQLNTASSLPALGSTFSFAKYELDYVKYFPNGPLDTLVAHVHLGSATGPLPLQEQYYLGGQTSLRGYASGRFRGDQMVLVTAEYRFPINQLHLLRNFGGITGIVFADAGDTEPFPVAPFNFKTDVGFGIETHTSIGVFRIDYGVGSEGGQLWITTGTLF